MPVERTKQWTRRETLAGLLAFAGTDAAARSRDGFPFQVADYARTEGKQDSRPLRLLIPKGSRANIDVITDQFHSLTGVSTDITEVSVREIATSLQVRRLQGKTDFDIALPPTYEIPDLVGSDTILALTEIDAGPVHATAAETALYTNGEGFDNRRYGYQTDGDVFLMFLNKSLLNDPDLGARYADRFGQRFESPASWEAFDQQARFVNEERDRPGAILFRAQGHAEWEFWLRLHAKGLWPLSADFEPQFDDEVGQSVLEDMIAIAPYVDPGQDGGRSFKPGWRRFADAGAFATFGWGGTQKLFSMPDYNLGDALVVAPIPGGSGPKTPASLPYFNWGWTYTIAHGARNPRLALAFILFAISPGISTQAVRQRNGFFDPFRAEHYHDEAIRDLYGKDFLAEHETSLSRAIPDFYVANRGAYFETLGSWLQLALGGTVPPDRALRNAADHWRLLTDATGQTKQALRWRQLRASYPPSVSMHLRDLST